jgi:hypothetical protein
MLYSHLIEIERSDAKKGGQEDLPVSFAKKAINFGVKEEQKNLQ